MSDTKEMFDFSNEGDNILANDSLKPKEKSDLSSDLLFKDIDIDEDQLSHFEKEKCFEKPNIWPFIDVVNLNEQNDDSFGEIKPNSAIVIGIKGEF